MTIVGWGFDVEILAIAQTNGLSIKACRINDWEDKPYSTYTDGMFMITIRMIKDFVHIRANKFRGKYS